MGTKLGNFFRGPDTPLLYGFLANGLARMTGDNSKYITGGALLYSEHSSEQQHTLEFFSKLINLSKSISGKGESQSILKDWQRGIYDVLQSSSVFPEPAKKELETIHNLVLRTQRNISNEDISAIVSDIEKDLDALPDEAAKSGLKTLLTTLGSNTSSENRAASFFDNLEVFILAFITSFLERYLFSKIQNEEHRRKATAAFVASFHQTALGDTVSSLVGTVQIPLSNNLNEQYGNSESGSKELQRQSKIHGREKQQFTQRDDGIDIAQTCHFGDPPIFSLSLLHSVTVDNAGNVNYSVKKLEFNVQQGLCEERLGLPIEAYSFDTEAFTQLLSAVNLVNEIIEKYKDIDCSGNAHLGSVLCDLLGKTVIAIASGKPIDHLFNFATLLQSYANYKNFLLQEQNNAKVNSRSQAKRIAEYIVNLEKLENQLLNEMLEATDAEQYLNILQSGEDALAYFRATVRCIESIEILTNGEGYTIPGYNEISEIGKKLIDSSTLYQRTLAFKSAFDNHQGKLKNLPSESSNVVEGSLWARIKTAIFKWFKTIFENVIEKRAEKVVAGYKSQIQSVKPEAPFARVAESSSPIPENAEVQKLEQKEHKDSTSSLASNLSTDDDNEKNDDHMDEKEILQALGENAYSAAPTLVPAVSPTEASRNQQSPSPLPEEDRPRSDSDLSDEGSTTSESSSSTIEESDNPNPSSKHKETAPANKKSDTNVLLSKKTEIYQTETTTSLHHS